MEGESRLVGLSAPCVGGLGRHDDHGELLPAQRPPSSANGTFWAAVESRTVPLVSIDHGLTLSYCEQGPTSGPAVVLLPGPTDSWRSYEPILGSIPGDLRVVAVSLRGHGDSSKPPNGYGIEDLAADVVPLLDALAIGRAVLVGHSGSCMVARRVALEHPERVAGLLLEASPTTLCEDAVFAGFVHTVVAGLSEPIDPNFASSFVMDTSTSALAPEFVDCLVEDLLKVPVAVWKQIFASLLVYDDTTKLSQVTAPVLLVWGDADQLVPRAMQDQLVELLPEARCAIYAGVGHTPRWEQPERFARDLTTFSSRVLGS